MAGKASRKARGKAWPLPDPSGMFALLFCLFLGLLLLQAQSAEASRFRYGTISWVPTSTIDTVNDLQTVEFTIRASFRRDYQWGAYFGEQWAQTSSSVTNKVFYGSEGTLQDASAGFDRTLAGCTDEALANVFTQNACFKCPGNTTTGYFGCENTNPQVDLVSSDSSSNGVSGEKFFIRFPPKMQNDGTTDVVPCPTPFHCDRAKANTNEVTKNTDFTNQLNTVTSALCDDFGNNPTKDATKCAPWSELYGMYMGDGTSKTIEMEVINMDTSTGRLGNSLTGVGTFTHAYKRNTADPFVAFFTGGERMYECNYPDTPLSGTGACEGSLNVLMNNNQQGRYRLEVEVSLTGDGNRSPVVHQIPVLPIPHQLPGVRAKFQIPASDPDGDALTFRFGNKYEMGGIIRSKSEAFPFTQNIQLTGNARSAYDINGKILANLGIEYGPYECDLMSKVFALTGKCPSDREPQEVSGVATHSFTSSVPGLVEWNTWTAANGSPCGNADGSGCSKLRSGFYNMVVMVSDSKVKVPVDFMTYLYDGPMFFCGQNCKSNVAGLPTHANLDGIYDSCTVCGYGEGNMTSSKCTPVTADGECGITENIWNTHQQVLETSIVPNPTSACKMNTAPKFATTGLVNGKLNNPRIDMYESTLATGSTQKPAITKYLGEAFEFYVTAIDTDDCAELSIDAGSLPVGATLSEPEYLSDYDEHPQGMKVRRKFTWQWKNENSDPVTSDPRERESLVCFYASDKYLATSQPPYCIELHLKPEPSKEEETLLRFNCKLTLNWQPVLKRFVVVDGSAKYYTASSYDDYMWHHAMVSINEGGYGQLYVDGLEQELEIHVGVDSSDVATYNKGTSIGKFFQAVEYPNNCVDTVSTSRRMLQFGQVTPDSTLDPAGTSCCSFRMGTACEDASTHAFDGLIDEVAVWNRALGGDEVASTLFHMPKSITSRTLEAPRGEQVNFAAGRAMYARFNNPCAEGPATGSKVSDGAGYSAHIDSTADAFDDQTDITSTGKYVYTGVPWATPFLTHTTVDTSIIPIDGGSTIKLYGLGFAKSPFMKCVAGLDIENQRSNGKYDYGYTAESGSTLVSNTELTSVMISPAKVFHEANDDLPFLVTESKRHPAQKTYQGQVRSDWFVSQTDLESANGGSLRFGNIPPFQTMPDHSWMSSSNLRDSFIYGFYEVAFCQIPNGIYPSESYYLGLSNDGAVSSSPKHRNMTYSEFSMKTTAGSSMSLLDEAKGKTFAMWFMPESDGDSTLMLLTNNLKLLWQGQTLKLVDSSATLSTSSTLALNEWHHFAIVIQNDVVLLYVDGVSSAPASVASVIGDYAVVNLANGLIGYIDELKVLQEAIDQTKIYDLMFTRYTQPGDVYMRFNDNQGYQATPLQTSVNPTATSVPWEPVSRYSVHVDGKPVSDDSVVEVSMLGGEEIIITGFNIAPSQWMKCNFGSYEEYSSAVQQGGNTADSTSPIGESDLNRPDGKVYLDVEYNLHKVDSSSIVASSPMTKVSESSYKCTVPTFPPYVTGVTLGFGEIVQEELEIEVLESSLDCDGAAGSYADGFASTSSVIETNYNGYTIALWAMPKTVSTQKQTVLAFQGTGTKSAIISYDGAKFSYFDEKILDVVPVAGSPPNQWHHVAVTVTNEGESTFYLNGEVAETFTTTSTPFPNNQLTLCANLNSANQGENLFTGLVDQVFVFKGALSVDEMKNLSANADIAEGIIQAQNSLGNTVSYFSSKSSSNFDIKGMKEVKTTSAWNGVTAFSVTPSSIPLKGGVDVTVLGTNFGAANLLSSNLGVIADSQPSTSELVITTPSETSAQLKAVGVTGGPSTVTYGDAHLEYAAKEVDLVSGLIAHYSMDIILPSQGSSLSTIFDDSGSENSLQWSPSRTEDRNGNPDGAILMGESYKALSGDIQTNFAAGLEDATICVWMRINFPSPHVSMPNVGGFKLYSLTLSGGKVNQVYVNDRKATSSESSILEGPLGSVFNGTLLDGLNAIVDEVWIYNRALSPAEVSYRYQVDDFAVDLSISPAYLTSDSNTSKVNLSSLEFWLKPKSFTNAQTFLKTSNFEIGFSGSDGFISVVATSGTSCTCTSCSAYDEFTSWKAALKPARWSHLAIDLTDKAMAIYVDGILVDRQTFSQGLNEFSMIDSENLAVIGESFDGLLYDVRLSTNSKTSAQYRSTTQCPKAASTGDTYFALKSGNTFEYAEGSSLKVKIPETAAWVDASFDDETYLDYTTFYGPGLISSTSGYPGRFTITAKTACSKKRKTGGDKYQVEFQNKEDGTKTTISASDPNDGNYHVSYSGLQCGLYDMTISSNGTAVKNVGISITPMGTSSTASYIVDVNSIISPNIIGCFGSRAKFYIQSMDDYGCKTGFDGADEWTATVSGPANLTVTGIHTMEGLYELTFVPPAAGKYTVQVKLGSTVFQTFCIDVCHGNSMYFYGNTAVEFEDPGQTFSLEGNTGLTMEAWVKPLADSGRDAYIIFKGSYADAGEFSKGYELVLTDSMSTISSTIYVGLGENRTITASNSFGVNTWTHLAVVYTGTEMNIYVNGALRASKPFSVSKPVHVNPYSHPLTIGYGYSGLVDEVKVFSYGKTSLQVQESMYCPSFLEKDNLVAYVGFNNATERRSPTALAKSSDVNPFAFADVKGKAVGPTPVGQVTNLDSPYFSNYLSKGVGVIGAAYTTATVSSTTGAGLFTMEVHAKDECGFTYNAVNAQAVKTVFNTFTEKYTNTVPTHEIGGNIEGTNYQLTDLTCGTGSGTYMVSGQLNSAGNYSVTVSVGSQVAAVHPLMVRAGSYSTFQVVQPGSANFSTGVASYLVIDFIDSYGNRVTNFDDLSASLSQLSYNIASEGVQASLHSSSEDLYTLQLLFTTPGSHTMNISATNTFGQIETQTVEVVVEPSNGLTPLLTNNNVVPDDSKRFEHTAVAYKGDLHIFGGAGSDAIYRSDVYKLNGVDDAFSLSSPSSFSYKRVLDISSLTSPDSGADAIIELNLNTLELIGMGRMLLSCKDLMFTLPSNGPALYHYIPHEPGCMSEETKVFIRIPAGQISDSLEMYYSNPASENTNVYQDGTKVFDFFEDFEGDSHQFSSVDACTLASKESSGFELHQEDDNKVLRLKAGSSVLLKAPATKNLTSFKLMARMYDANSPTASHWISPNYNGCDNDLHPLHFVGAGVHTLSHTTKYCTASPWRATSVPREQGGHLLEILGTPASTTIKIDGTVVRQTSVGSTFEGVTLSSGYGMLDKSKHASSNLEDSHVLFDDIYVMPYTDKVVTSSGTSGDVLVSRHSDESAGRSWKSVSTKNSPSPRYSHTGALLNETYYVFGGERSGTAFNDVWQYDFSTSDWSFVSAITASPPARFDHAVVAFGDKTLIVMGGRNAAGTTFKDMWALDISTKTWIFVGELIAPSYGLAAASVGSDIYVLGGYSKQNGFSTSLNKCTVTGEGISMSISCTDITQGCPEATNAQTLANVGFTPRYQHSMFTYNTKDVYVYGGVKDDETSPTGDAMLYKLDTATCSWSVVANLCRTSNGPATCVLYESVAGPMEKGMFVHGGFNANGLVEESTYVYPL